MPMRAAARRAVIRDDQLELVRHCGDSRLTLVVAPAGYGKTTLVSAASSMLRWRIAWVTLDETDGDPFVFLSSLAAALTPVLPQAARGLAGAATSMQSYGSPAKEAVDPFVESLDSTERRRVRVVLDDYHVVAGSAATNAVVDRLIEASPAGLSFVIASRQAPPLASIGRLRFDDEVSVVSPADLVLDHRQTAAIVAAHGGRCSDAEATRAIDLTGGWAAGTVLLAKAGVGERLAKAGDIKAAPSGREDLFNYLAEQVLAGEPEVMQEFLKRTAVLDVVTPAVAREITGVASAKACLSQLVERGLFTRVEADGRSYRYHSLFRAFLLRQLAREFDEDELRQLRGRVARALARRGQSERALALFVSTGDSGAAVDLLREWGLTALAESSLVTLRSLADSLMLERGPRDPWTALLDAWISFRDGRLDEMYETAQLAARLLAEQEDRGGEYLALQMLQEYARWLTLDEESLVYGERALALADSDEQRASVLCELAFSAVRLARWEQFDEIRDRVRGLLGAASPEDRAMLLGSEGAAAKHRGDLVEALRATRVATDSMRAARRTRSSVYASILAALGYFEAMAGEYGPAAEHLARADRLCTRHGFLFLRVMIVDFVGCLAAFEGRFSTAFELFEQAWRDPRLTPDPESACAVASHMGSAWRRTGDLETARAWYRRAVDKAAEARIPWDLVSTPMNLAYVEGRLDRRIAERERERLAGLRKEAREAGFEFLDLKGRFFTALLATDADDRGGEAGELTEVVERMVKLGQLNFVAQEVALERGVLLAVALRIDRREALQGVIAAVALHWNARQILSTLVRRLTAAAAEAWRVQVVREAIQRLPTRAQKERDALSAWGRTAASSQAGRRAPKVPWAGEGDDLALALPELSPRERQVLVLLSEGASNNDIAARLVLSPATVKTHVHRILKKLGVRSRLHAARLCRDRLGT